MANTMEELYRLQVTIAADRASIYNALTSAEALETWFAESAEVDLPARRYDFWGRYTPETPDREQGRHEIIAAEQDSLLRFAWPLEGVATEVEYRLHPRPSDGTTILIVTHTGCGKDASAPCAPEDFWFLVLENLRRHVEGRQVHSRFDFHTLNSQGDIRHEIEIDAPAGVVFSKLVEPAELNRWLAYNASVEPQGGGTFDLGWGEGMSSTILEIDPPSKLVYGWAGTQVVTWTLEGSGGKTRLLIVHSGFDPGSVPGERLGWLNYITWIGSMSEVGPSWESPLCLVNKEYPMFYSRSLNERQSELLPHSVRV